MPDLPLPADDEQDRVEFELVLDDYWPFRKGEIMIVGSHWGRELLGEGRKSGKWDVSTILFSTAAEAVEYARAHGIEPEMPDGYPDHRRVPGALTELHQALPEETPDA